MIDPLGSSAAADVGRLSADTPRVVTTAAIIARFRILMSPVPDQPGLNARRRRWFRSAVIWNLRKSGNPRFENRCLKFVHRRLVERAGEILVEGPREDRVVRRHLREQRHAGVELEIVQASRNLMHGAMFDCRSSVARSRAVSGPSRMLQIGDRFSARADGVTLRHRAVAEAGDLREDEPHPVAALGAGTELRKYPWKRRGLSVDKSLQIVWIVHDRCSVGIRRSDEASGRLHRMLISW